MMQKATFAAGCFWGVEAAFRKIDGVIDAVSGYTGGATANPSYEQVCSGMTGHAEAVQVTFDPKIVSYEKLLSVFWSIHDPSQLNRQGPDIGKQYRSAIFYHGDEQKRIAIKSKQGLEKAGKFKDRIVTAIEPIKEFYRAEEYHQRYFEKNKRAVC